MNPRAFESGLLHQYFDGAIFSFEGGPDTVGLMWGWLKRLDRRHYATVGIIAFFLAMNTATSKSGGSSSSSGPTPVATTATTVTPTATVAPKKKEITAIETTGRTLYADYQANEVSADDTYKGKALLVKGLVVSIDKDFRQKMYVKLAGGEYEFQTVWAFVDESEKSTVASLSKGDVIKLLCTGDGMVVKTPKLKDCTIVSTAAE